MKKILISVLIFLMFILCALTIFKGINVLGVNIIGFTQIQEKKAQLDESIDKATVLASTDYYDIVNKDIVNDLKKLKEEKKNYEDLVEATGTSGVQSTSQYQKYEIEYLWAILGNHATSEGVKLKIELVSGALENSYNLNFTVTGEYIGIKDFISDIENDSVLGFKIENFSLVPGSSSSELSATFTCKDIEIKGISNDNAVNTETENGSSNTNTSNTSNTTNTTSSSNTTNTTNTSNTTNTTNSTNSSNTTR